MKKIICLLALSLSACGNDGNGSNNQIGSGNKVITNVTVTNVTNVVAQADGNLNVSTAQTTNVQQNVSVSQVTTVSSFTDETESTGETGQFDNEGTTYNYYKISDTNVYYWYRDESQGLCVTIHQKNETQTVYAYACNEVGEAIEEGEEVYTSTNDSSLEKCIFQSGELINCELVDNTETDPTETDPTETDPTEVGCAMPAHNGVSSVVLSGVCGAKSDCGGLVYFGSDCQEICCISNDEISSLQNQTYNPDTNELSTCSTNNGICVEEGSCDGFVSGYFEQSGGCPDDSTGQIFTICCQPE